MEEAKISKSQAVSTKGLDFIITGSILGIFFLLPLFFTGFVAQGLGFEKMILFYFLVLIGVVAWVTKGVINGELNLKRTPLDIPILITLAFFIVSTFLSISAKDSLLGAYGSPAKGLIAFIVFVLFYYLTLNNLDAKKIKNIFIAVISSASLLILFSLLQLKGWYILPIAITKSKSFNLLGSLSSLTMFLVILLPILVVAATQIKEIFPRINNLTAIIIRSFLGIIIFGNLIILAMLNGYVSWPAAIVGIVIILMFFLAKIIKVNNNNLLIPLAVFLTLIILLVIGNFDIFNTKEKLSLPAEVSLSRGASWDIAKSSLRDNLFFGSGPSTFYYSFSKYKDNNFNLSPLWNVRFDSASGSLFELLSTVGILGTLSVLILFLISLSILFLSLVKNKDKELNSILLGLFASFVSLILLSLSFSESNSLILISVLISIFSVASAVVIYPEKFGTINLSFRSSANYALALAAIFLGVSASVVVLFTMGLKMYLADAYAKEALNTGNIDQKIVYLEKSISLAPYRDVYYLNLANNYMAKANTAATTGGQQDKVAEFLGKAIDYGKKSVAIAPNKAANNESLALIYENASFYARGALESSEFYYKKVEELDPNNPAPHLRIALVNMARANSETDEEEKKYYINEAIKKYDESITIKSDLAAAYYGKAIAYEKLGNIDKSIEELSRANISSGNQNIDYLFELGRLYFNRGVSNMVLDQTASQKIAENDITPSSGTSTPTVEDLSINSSKSNGTFGARNQDLNNAEQLFLSIIKANSNHANALYSLAVLYQKIRENDNARTVVNRLIDVLQDNNQKDQIKKQFADILK